MVTWKSVNFLTTEHRAGAEQVVGESANGWTIGIVLGTWDFLKRCL